MQIQLEEGPDPAFSPRRSDHNCLGTNKWCVVADPGQVIAEATYHHPQPLHLRIHYHNCDDRLSTESDHVAPTCLGHHCRANFYGFLQRHCSPCRGITSWILRIAPRFERVKRSTRSLLSLCSTESTRRLPFVHSLL